MAVTENVNETWATDGSREAYAASLIAQVKDLKAQLRLAEGRRIAVVQILDRVAEQWNVAGRSQQAKALIREARIVLDHGMAQTQQQQADAIVEEWLHDPDRNIFGLAADLADVLSRRV
jgi:hypothetical protein